MRFRVWGPVYEVFHEASGPRDKYTKVQEQSAKLQQGCESILFMIEHLRTYDSAIFQLVELPSVSVGAACCREKRCSRRLLPTYGASTILRAFLGSHKWQHHLLPPPWFKVMLTRVRNRKPEPVRPVTTTTATATATAATTTTAAVVSVFQPPVSLFEHCYCRRCCCCCS